MRLSLLVLLLATTATSSAAPDTRPLPARGWALYFNALHEPQPGTVGAGFTVERVTGDLQRLVPGGDFAGLGAGQSVEIEYLTSLITNHSFAPVGPYVVFAGSIRASGY